MANTQFSFIHSAGNNYDSRASLKNHSRQSGKFNADFH